MARKKRVLVTGATGIIGTIVREDLAGEFEFTFLSRRKIDEPGFVQLDVAEDYAGLERLVAGADAVLHLAYVEEGPTNVTNLKMAKNVYSAALSAPEPPRLVMASSIHAVAGHVDWSRPPFRYIASREYGRLGAGAPLITTRHRRLPNGVYGALKCYIEILGEFYAGEGLEVVCVRFGGVRTDDSFPEEPGYHAFWLSRRDCAEAVRRSLNAPLGRNYNLIFAVSANSFGIYDLSDARELIGFEPKDDAEAVLGPPSRGG